MFGVRHQIVRQQNDNKMKTTNWIFPVKGKKMLVCFHFLFKIFLQVLYLLVMSMLGVGNRTGNVLHVADIPKMFSNILFDFFGKTVIDIFEIFI